MNDATVIVINRDGMGQAAPALAHKLLGTFLELTDLGASLPRALCLYAEGVKLTVPGSPVPEELKSLADHGVEIVVCTTCLNYYELLGDLAVGRAGSMRDIIELQTAAAKVITL